ncbi:MAG: MBL fold metallo-hydrolase [Spirochaetes bacterium]|nr:MBL fold metallo-hydrolase [Spirochaetota bacterium]
MKKIFKFALIGTGLFSVFSVILILFLLKDGFTDVKTVIFSVPEQNAVSWENIFSNSEKIELIAYNTGVMEGDRYPEIDMDMPDRNKGYDVNGYIIRHKTRGDFLVDTGFDESFYRNPPFGNSPFAIKLLLNLISNNNFTLHEDRNINLYLKKYAVKPEGIFFTHLHFDHIAGVPAVTDDVKLIMDGKEINFINKAQSLGSYLKGKNNFYTLDFSKGIDMPVLGKCIDVFGDGSFLAISTPGHSAGHVSYIVNSVNGPALVTGDAVFYKNSLKYNLGHKIFDADYDRAVKTRQKIIEFLKLYPEVIIYPGHEAGPVYFN